tara:strand:+ start:419 stop:1234 length:816 start_codon:yes stop_codon:yes gene_type:complete
MEYLTGYTIKPHTVTRVGEVRFTDGTNTDMGANQVTCEAYGYTYDIASGTCVSFRYNTNLNRNISNINNKNNGAGNSTELGSNTIQINGTNNTTKGFNNNCFISGSNNEIANGVDNATVLGSHGEALRDGEFVVSSGDGVGQTSTFFLNGTTTNNTRTPLFVNGDAAVTLIARNVAYVYSYVIEINAYRTGGTSGTGAVGDRAFWSLRGITKGSQIDETLTLNDSYGTVTGWTAAMVSDVHFPEILFLGVTGVTAMDITWTATARFNEMKI